MPRVTGIGGVFFKADDRKAMLAWYREHLGIPTDEYGWGFQWRELDRPDEVGRTQWGPFDRDTDYFGPKETDCMINYRVDDLAALLAQLEAAGIEQVKPMESYEYGTFAWVEDPEGNRIELWEPSAGPPDG